MRDFMGPTGENRKLYPYAKNLFYHPSGVLSMTIEVYDDINTQEFTFGFTPAGKLRTFLDQLYEVDNDI
jgi:hypothetical protein